MKASSPQVKEIWDLIKETRKDMAEYQKNMKESQKGLKKLRDLFETQWGKLMESLVEGELIKLLNEKGIKVDYTSSRLQGEYKGQSWEFDIIAVNGKEVALVEVKTTLKVKDTEYFISKLKSFTKWRPEYKGKTIYGAVAYLRSDEHSTKHAEKQGLFVIRATGSSANIINKKGFKPKAFS